MLTVTALDRFEAPTASVGDLVWPHRYWFTVEAKASVRGRSIELSHPEDALVIEALRLEYRRQGEQRRSAHVLSRTRAVGRGRWLIDDVALEELEDPHETFRFNPFDVLGSLRALHAVGERRIVEVVSVGFVARAKKPFSGPVRLVASPLDASRASDATLAVHLS